MMPIVIPHCGTEGKASTASECRNNGAVYHFTFEPKECRPVFRREFQALLGICFWRESRDHGGRLRDSLRAEVSQDHFVFSPPTRQ